jgi:hypothetical protein
MSYVSIHSNWYDTRIEIALPDGVTVRVGRGIDGAALRRVLTALGR